MKEKEHPSQHAQRDEEVWPTRHGSWANAWCMPQAPANEWSSAAPSKASTSPADDRDATFQRPAP
jgi:type II secretory pathway pseudopilin PulG